MSQSSTNPTRDDARPYTVYFCSHTHWDREWYASFQQYRYRLVRLIDRLMDLLERDPEYRCFNLDGQTVPIEDYLEVKPEQRARLQKLIAEGRIAVGPWYILPDEWLVSGEATVRNLLRGRRVCRDLGVQPSRAAYMPDMFGHISQIPQILMGFGMENCIMWRGLSGAQWKSELWWDAPDGSRVLTHHLPEYCGYGNAMFFYPALPAEARTKDDAPWMINEDPEFAAQTLRPIADRCIKAATTNVLLMLNGIDHMEPHPQAPQILRLARDKHPDLEFRHATFEEFLTELRARVPEDLQTITGEQRSTAVAPDSGTYVLPNILSSRVYLKLANARCQTLLEKWTEPFSAFSAWLGADYPEGHIQTAWKWLLRNHPHDSIGGCSCDEVHRNMETRFSWAADIAETLTGANMYRIAENIDTQTLADGERACAVFNPLNWTVSDLVTLELDLDEGWLRERGCHLNRANIYDSVRNIGIREWDGREAKFELLNVECVLAHKPWIETFAPVPMVVRVRVALWAEELPPMGCKCYRLYVPPKMRRLPDRHGTAQPAVMENEHLRVKVKTNGTLRIETKGEKGRVFDNLHYFEDGGDNGDGYTYSPPRHDAVVTSLASDMQITRLLDGEAAQSIAVDYRMELPAGLEPTWQRRTGETVTQRIRSVFTLGKDSRRVDVQTTLTNVAKDHRLRVCFPSPGTSGSHVAEMQFDVVRRDNKVVQPPEELWIEDMPLEQPNWNFVSCGALGVANVGINEYEVVGETGGEVVKLTLLRAAAFLGAGPNPNTIQNGAGPFMETPEQQMLGRTLVFDYALVPHAGCWVDGRVQREAAQLAAAWRAAVTGCHAGAIPPTGLSFMKVEGKNVSVSATKQVEDVPNDYVTRFWNSGSKDSEAVVTWHAAPTAVFLSNLAEEKLEELKTENGCLRIAVRPKQIVTIRYTIDARKD